MRPCVTTRTRARTRRDTPPALPGRAPGPERGLRERCVSTPWIELQPKATLRYKPTDNITLYGGWSRGFRSGGFNQTGVGAVALRSGIYGVSDLFNAEVADTFEVGWKGEFLDRRLNAGVSVYSTKSTQRLLLRLPGRELDAEPRQPGCHLQRSGIRAERQADRAHRPVCELRLHGQPHRSAGEHRRQRTRRRWPPRPPFGNQAPLVSRTTTNLGAQYRQPLAWRADRHDPARLPEYRPHVVGPAERHLARSGVAWSTCASACRGEKWSVAAWSKNLTNKIYNAEFSPGGFLWRAPPRRYRRGLRLPLLIRRIFHGHAAKLPVPPAPHRVRDP